MMKKLKRQEKEAEIFTDSMADISFLLVIYFMVTSVFSATKGLDFQLPEETDTPEIKKEEAIDIYVPPEGAYQVDGTAMPLEEILPYVGDKLEKNPKKPVILRTDPNATYNRMIVVFDELRQSEEKIGMKIETISIPTQREIENIWTRMGL